MKKVNGFTIVELLVYISIVTIALTVFTSFVADVTKHAASSKINTEVQQNARLLLSRLTQAIRNGQNIDTSVPNKLTLQNFAGITISYSWNSANKTVEYQEGVGPLVTISNNNVSVSSLTFTKTNNIIAVNLIVEQRDSGNSPAGNDKIILSSTVAPRQEIYN